MNERYLVELRAVRRELIPKTVEQLCWRLRRARRFDAVRYGTARKAARSLADAITAPEAGSALRDRLLETGKTLEAEVLVVAYAWCIDAVKSGQLDPEGLVDRSRPDRQALQVLETFAAHGLGRYYFQTPGD